MVALRGLGGPSDAVAAGGRLKQVEGTLGRAIWGIWLLAECVRPPDRSVHPPGRDDVWLGTALRVGAIAVGIVAGAAAAGPIDKMIGSGVSWADRQRRVSG
jgi:hypothetical protein